MAVDAGAANWPRALGSPRLQPGRGSSVLKLPAGPFLRKSFPTTCFHGPSGSPARNGDGADRPLPGRAPGEALVRFLTPVVWHEGMHLAQHHFQAQSRYFEELASFVLAELYFKPYGVAACEFDVEALRNDTLALRHARGIMPDGLVFHFPDEALPEPREVRSLFSPTQDSHLVLLAIPPLRPGRQNCADGDGFPPPEPPRFRPATREVTDEATGADAKPVAFAQKNFRLLLDAEDAAGLVTLPLARVRRDGSGHFVFDDAYVPPSLQIGASPRLVALLAGLVEGLGQRVDSLAAERADAPGELVNHWLASAVNISLGPLTHQLRTRRAHPEQLYAELLRLAGALCTFSLEAHPRDLPMYDHDRLDECFGALEERIRQLLDVVAPSSSVRIPLRATGDSFFAGTVTDSRCLGAVQWFLGVRSSESPAEVSARVPRLVKVCSSKFIERLVREAFPGLPLQHVLSPSPEISPRPGMEYFAIPRSGPCWASIVETREVGVYAPASIPDAELELVIAVGSGG
jgi:type VI secretion system protein ImpJ